MKKKTSSHHITHKRKNTRKKIFLQRAMFVLFKIEFRFQFLKLKYFKLNIKNKI